MGTFNPVSHLRKQKGLFVMDCFTFLENVLGMDRLLKGLAFHEPPRFPLTNDTIVARHHELAIRKCPDLLPLVEPIDSREYRIARSQEHRDLLLVD